MQLDLEFSCTQRKIFIHYTYSNMAAPNVNGLLHNNRCPPKTSSFFWTRHHIPDAAPAHICTGYFSIFSCRTSSGDQCGYVIELAYFLFNVLCLIFFSFDVKENISSFYKISYWCQKSEMVSQKINKKKFIHDWKRKPGSCSSYIFIIHFFCIWQHRKNVGISVYKDF